MPWMDTILAEFDYEMAITRTLLERVPEDRFAWQPHPRSMRLVQLANHVATLPSWIDGILERDSYDMGRVKRSDEDWEARAPRSRQGLLDVFDENVRGSRAKMAAASDALLEEPWSLMNHDDAVLTMSRGVVLETMFLNHMVHHRGQLSVYLRLLDVPVPAIYGPSADETMV